MALDTDPTPLQIFIAAAGIGAIAGLASALKSTAVLTGRYVGSSVITAALTSLLTALIGHNLAREQSNVWILLGISGLAGFGGATLLDAAVAVLVKFVGAKGNELAAPFKPSKYVETPSDEVKQK